MNKIAITFNHKMKTLLIICAGCFLSGNGLADPLLDAIKQAQKDYKEQRVKRADYLSTVETLDLENSTYAGSELYKVFTDNRPQIGEEKKVFSGDKMVIQRTGKIVPCIIPKETWTRTIKRMVVGEMIFEIKKDRKLCRLLNDSEQYISDYSMAAQFGENFETMTAIVWKKRDKFRFAVMDKMNTVKEDAIEGKDFEYTKAFKSTPNRLQQSIEYSGRIDSALTFIYSEFDENIARVAFTREFTVDLNEGNMGGFKGAVFEVLEATNFEIAYKIIRHFP